MEGKSSQEIQKIEKLPSGYQYPQLAPIEHKIIGSTPGIKGQIIELGDLIERFHQGDKLASDILLTPTGIQGEGEKVKPLVILKRLEQNLTRSLRGIPIISSKVQREFMRSDIEVCLELSRVDSDNQVGREWRIFLVREQEAIGEAEQLRKLELASFKDSPLSPDKVFSLKFPKGTNYAVLTFNYGKGQKV